MTIRTLVLTPHISLLPQEGFVVFAGGWCLTRDMRMHLKERRLDYQEANYPWDDRAKYRQDYIYLMSVYESMLRVLTPVLNELHKAEFNVAYWRMLAGPALYTLLCHLLDRWRVASEILENERFDVVPFFEHKPYAFTPKTTIDINPDSDDYNHYLLISAILKAGLESNKLVRIENTSKVERYSVPVGQMGTMQAAKESIYGFIKKVVDLITLSKYNKYFIFKSYLPRIHELILNVFLCNFPEIRRANRVEFPTVSQETRLTININPENNDDFQEFAKGMLITLLPIYLIEGYGRLEPSWRKSNWPSSPKAIFTAVAYQFDEVFQHYAATMRLRFGTKLVIGQHGGVSGILKWSYGEDHQLSVADKFISWGWEAKNKKIVPGFVLTNLGKKIKPAADGALLLTTGSMRRYSHKGGAWPVGPNQAKVFLSQQMTFRRRLAPEIARQLTLRIISAQDIRFGSEFVDTWKSEFTDIKIDDSSKPIKQALNRAKLFVYTYNSTGYLETLSLNFPTIMFWDTEYFETSPVFSTLLNELEQVGIFHRSPESAADHVNRVWTDLDLWWNAPDVISSRNHFSNNFARKPPAYWKSFLKRSLND